jgi:hypothetical protein
VLAIHKIFGEFNPIFKRCLFNSPRRFDMLVGAEFWLRQVPLAQLASPAAPTIATADYSDRRPWRPPTVATFSLSRISIEHLTAL